MLKRLMTITALALASSTAAAQSSTPIRRPIPSQASMEQISAALQRPISTELFARVRGPGSFVSAFDPDARSYNATNAYVLTYLATMMYPQSLAPLNGEARSASYVDKLHADKDAFFEAEYARALLEPLRGRTPARFKLVKTDPKDRQRDNDWDAEAMVIDSEKAIFIVFRGTDRVLKYQRGSIGYDWSEWLKTDFRFFPQDAGLGKGVMVHEGFWQSTKTIRHKIMAHIDDTLGQKNAATKKKLWIAGHSLGAAQAQVMAAWLAREGVAVQGVLAVAAPHPGNAEFTSYLRSKYPDGAITRTEFKQDPVTMLPLPAMGFGRAGKRVYYDDVNSVRVGAAERPLKEHELVFHNASQAGVDIAHGLVKLPGEGTYFCYHHPEWYLQAAYNTLPTNVRKTLPAAPDAPGKRWEACGDDTVRRGLDADAQPTNEVVAAVGNAIKTFTFNVANALANITGTAVKEGRYYLRNNKGGKYLDVTHSCMNEDGCDARLYALANTHKNNIFRIRKDGLNYVIELDAANKLLEVEAYDAHDNGGRIQTWSQNPWPGFNGNQHWWLYRVSSDPKENAFLIINDASKKVLDAVNKCAHQDGCGVQLWDAVSDDQSQVWWLEPVK